MKKNLSTTLRSYALLPLWGLGGLFFTGCATTNQSNAVTQTANVNPPVYNNGNDEPTANSMHNDAPAYFTGNNEPVASSNGTR